MSYFLFIDIIQLTKFNFNNYLNSCAIPPSGKRTIQPTLQQDLEITIILNLHTQQQSVLVGASHLGGHHLVDHRHPHSSRHHPGKQTSFIIHS